MELASNVLKTVGQRLRWVRGEKSRPVFGAEFNINKNTLARYEKDDTSPDIVLSGQICDSCRIDLNWFVYGKGDPHLRETLDEGLVLNKTVLFDAIETLEEALESSDRTMSSESKAKVLVMIYELFLEESEQSNTKNNIKNILKLVA